MESIGCGSCSRCRDDGALEAIAVELTAVADRMRSAGLSHDRCHAALDAALTAEPAMNPVVLPGGVGGIEERLLELAAIAAPVSVPLLTPREAEQRLVEEVRSSSAWIADAEGLGEAA